MADPEVFDRIYRDRVWGNGIDAPLSGPGSMSGNSAPVIRAVEDFADSQQKTSILDLGCGDLTYLHPVLSREDIGYLGVDISGEAVRKARERSIPGAVFLQDDITRDGFRAHADVMILKDVIFHLTDMEILKVLQNLAHSSFSLLILNSDPGAPASREFDRYHWCRADLEASPFAGSLAALGSAIRRSPRPDGGDYLFISR